MQPRIRENPELDETRYRLVVPAVVIATLFLVLAIYFGGYFAATTGVGYSRPSGARVRVFGASWQARIFTPAARIESLFVGQEVHPEW